MGLAMRVNKPEVVQMEQSVPQKRVVLLGATGTAGRAAADALIAAGHDLLCFGRSDPQLASAAFQQGDVFDPEALARALAGADVVVSCLASRSGAPQDAWLVDYDAQRVVLTAAQAQGVAQFVLLSAICVQKPQLAFQQAKLAFEAVLKASGLTYSIVRPTAFFKSLSGQVDRIRAGKPFLVFGDGKLTACKPISDRNLGRFIASCLTDPTRQNAELPIGGPGPAITPLEQGEMLFDAFDQTPRFKHVPVWFLRGIAGALAFGGRFNARLAEKAALARIGIYYATQSMLVWDGEKYDADATPEYGTDLLSEYYQQLAQGAVAPDLGAHKVF